MDEDGGVDLDVATTDQRQRLLAGTNRLNDASKRLAESHRLALETEEIGAQTLVSLRNQREQIVRANDRVSLMRIDIERLMVVIVG